jgi:DNA repair protein RadC
VRDAAQVYEAFREQFSQLDREMFVTVLLDGKNQVFGFNTVSIGSLTATLVHPREVFLPAILHSAASVVLVHNHPSGDPSPSEDDRLVTARLVQAARGLGIRLLDHVITGDGRCYSFADAGEMR